MNRTEVLAQTYLKDACLRVASDIHFHPGQYGDKVHVYYRLLGKRKFIRSMSINLYKKVLAYFKYSAHMDIGDIRKPQSGKMIFNINDDDLYALRLSTLPTVNHESLTIRILPQHNLQLDRLFVFPYQFKKMKEWFRQEAGLILFTGPTGCGKSTTMYALLQSLIDETPYQAITLEDPIERTIDNVIQVEINEKAGVTYDTGLKAALRHDPDIIMVGEIRDEKTAMFALEASLTGHLVISTIHAKNATGTIDRLLDLNISHTDIRQSLIAVASIQLIPLKTKYSHTERGAIIELLEHHHIQHILSNPQLEDEAMFETFDYLKEKVDRYGFLSQKIY